MEQNNKDIQAIVNIHLMHTIRHSIVMRLAVNTANSHQDLIDKISNEMQAHIMGMDILASYRYEDFVDWFIKNTPQEVLDQMNPGKKEEENQQEENPADEIPF